MCRNIFCTCGKFGNHTVISMCVWFTWGTRKKVFFLINRHPITLEKILASSLTLASIGNGPKWSYRSTPRLLIDSFFFNYYQPPHGVFISVLLSTILALWSLPVFGSGTCVVLTFMITVLNWIWHDREFVCMRQSVELHDILSSTLHSCDLTMSQLPGSQMYFILSVTCVSVCHCCDGTALMLSSVSQSPQLSWSRGANANSCKGCVA